MLDKQVQRKQFMKTPRPENSQKTSAQRPLKKLTKKSETLEVRISYETKQKLSKQADTENRTVSDLVRSLIHEYLSKPQSSASTFDLRINLMRMKKFITQKPITAFASFAAILAASLSFIPAASAEDIQLNLQGEFIQPEGDGTRTRRFNTNIISDYGSTVIISVDGLNLIKVPNTSDSSISNLTLQDGLWVKIKTEKGATQNSNETLTIYVSIINTANGDETIIAEPFLTTHLGTPAEVLISSDKKNSYSLKFLADKPS